MKGLTSGIISGETSTVVAVKMLKGQLVGFYLFVCLFVLLDSRGTALSLSMYIRNHTSGS